MKMSDAAKLLKPCPCCGVKEIEVVKDTNMDSDSIFYVECSKCGLRTKDFTMSAEYSVIDKLVETWNKRTTDLAMDGRTSSGCSSDSCTIMYP